MFTPSQLVERIAIWLKNEQKATRREIAVERARAMAKVKSLYVLGAGGRDPKAKTPHTKRNELVGSDCVGFTCWALQHDRYQPETFEIYDGWLNTDSIMMDARGPQDWYAEVSRPEPGDVVVFPSIHRDGKRVRMGHIGLVVEAPDGMPENVHRLAHDQRLLWLSRVKVIDCAASSKRKPYAISETTAAASWNKPDAMWARCVRY